MGALTGLHLNKTSKALLNEGPYNVKKRSEGDYLEKTMALLSSHAPPIVRFCGSVYIRAK